MPRNFTENFYGPEGTQRALAAPGVPRGGQNPPGHARRPSALGGCPPLGCPRTASSLYKYPNIPETLKAIDEIFIQPP